MRSALVILLLALSVSALGQGNYLLIDRQTYDQYLRNDYKNLKRTSGNAIAQGIDFYYLRMRIGILSYNHQRYRQAVNHFTKAIEFNSWDTISREYIYYSYLFAGRYGDANLFLSSIPRDKKNYTLKHLKPSSISNTYLSTSASAYDAFFYSTNSLYYEAMESNLGLSAGVESYFSPRLRGNFVYTYFSKKGKAYSSATPEGKTIDFTQNQLYARLTRLVFPGWEFTGFGHYAMYNDIFSSVQAGTGRRASRGKLISEYLGGIGIIKNSWYLRGGVSASYSNFGKSNQLRGEGHLMYLPFANLNLYFTAGGMYQTDTNWGSTYQVNQEIGLRVCKYFWLEGGAIQGNAFLYARNLGIAVNNSYLIPSSTIYSNLIFLVGKRFSVTLTPYFSENHLYSWDIINYTRTDRVVVNSYGINLKINIKN
jgi:hypothetical protein